jgi:hypothetical protein
VIRRWPYTLSLLAVVIGCGDDGSAIDAGEPDATPVEPAFPADYAGDYVEVRNCRRSSEHELRFIRVLVEPEAVGPYMDRVTPFSDGSIVLKEEYDLGDATCDGPIVVWTVMVKRAAAAEELGWHWQEVDADRDVTESNSSLCYGCHSACTGEPPDDIGYDFTCTEP